MNDEHIISDEDLVLATSRRLPGDCALSVDAAEAREAFLSLGSALQADAQMLDEQALVQRIVGRLNRLDAVDGASAEASVGSCPPLVEARQRGERHVGWGRFKMLVVSGVLAAAACFAMFRAPTSPETQNQEQPQIAVAESPQGVVLENVAPKSATVPVEEPIALAWNDPLDDEIAIAAAAMSRMSASSRDVDVSLYDMNEVLSALSAELAGESL